MANHDRWNAYKRNVIGNLITLLCDIDAFQTQSNKMLGTVAWSKNQKSRLRIVHNTACWSYVSWRNRFIGGYYSLSLLENFILGNRGKSFTKKYGSSRKRHNNIWIFIKPVWKVNNRLIKINHFLELRDVESLGKY